MVGKENLPVKKILDKIIDDVNNKEKLNNNCQKIVKPKKRKKKKNRCSFNGCNKKLKLTDFPCRCKNKYCAKHRTQESHNCIELQKVVDKEKFISKCGLGGGVADKLIKI